MRRIVPLLAAIAALSACGIGSESGQTSFGDIRDDIDRDYLYSAEEIEFLTERGFPQRDIARMEHWDTERAEQFAAAYREDLGQIDVDTIVDELEAELEAQAGTLRRVGDTVELRRGPVTIRTEVIDREWVRDE